MANNRNYSTSRTSDAPLTREEFFREPSQGRYQTRIRTEGSLAAQPEEVYVPRRRPRQGENGQAKRRPASGHDRGTANRTSTHRETEEERRARLRRERQRRLAEERRRQEQAATSDRRANPTTAERRARAEMVSTRQTETETARLRRSAAKAPEKEQGVMSDQREARSSVSSGNRMSFGSKFGFLLSAAIIMIGCMMIVLSYVRIFNKNSEIASLKRELTTVQETNKVAQQRQVETMNMNELYSYAVDTLGMVDAEVDDIITITIVNQSYTTSNLPVADIGESKVRFHWWFE